MLFRSRQDMRSLGVSLRGIPGVCQLLDVVYQAKQQPLAVHLRALAQREAIEPLVVAQVAKHRRHGAKALLIPLAPRGGIEALLHAHRVRF